MTNPDVPPQLRVRIRWTLQVGVLLASALLIVGIALSIASGTPGAITVPSKVDPATLPGELAHGHGSSFLLLGVAALVLTPLARVVLSVGVFAMGRNIPFTLITASVLLVLAVSIVVGVET